MNLPDNYPPLLAEIAQEVSQALAELAVVDAPRSEEIGLAVVERIRARFGGVSQYIPKGEAVDLAKRDWEMYAKFDGTNYAKLAIEYDLTERRVREIVKTCTEEDHRRRQIALL